jgi:hypothetical protein
VKAALAEVCSPAADRRPLCDYTTIGLTVVWEKVVAKFLAAPWMTAAKRQAGSSA